ncbi:MAG: hypothetical protein JWN71_2934 [Xanthobacteraceae bacterium]|nr:hypothetical protein [Xanthobacteraceae bacterium]
MSEPWLTTQGRINVIAAWTSYAGAHPTFDDVRTYGNLTLGSMNLGKVFSSQSPARKWIGGGILSTFSRDTEFKARLTLDAMKIKYSTPEVITFWGELSYAHVKRKRPDGSIATTALTEWEKYSAVMLRYGGFDPTNIMSFIRDTVDRGVKLSQSEKVLLESLGIKVDLLLTIDPSELKSRSPRAIVPPELKQKIERRDVPGDSSRLDREYAVPGADGADGAVAIEPNPGQDSVHKFAVEGRSPSIADGSDPWAIGSGKGALDSLVPSLTSQNSASPSSFAPSSAAPNASEDPTAGMASITIVVGAGFPGHTTIQINRGEKATYLGLGPKTAGEPKDVASYDVVTLDKDVSPVAALRKEAINPGEYHYVDATHNDVKSFTLPISDEQADKAMAAALKYQVKNPNYNGYPVLVGTDYALNVLEAAIPGSDMSALSRIPSILQKELVSLTARGDGLVPSRGDRNPVVRTGLTGLQQDEKPPQFNIKQQFNDKVPFNFASGEVGISGQPNESKAQVSLTRGRDGSAELSVGDSTFVNFESGQLASVANSDGKLRLSFSKDESRDKFFGNVMAVDTGTGDVAILDKHGRLSNLEAGSRINITSAGWDHASEVRPNDLERAGSERSAAGFG